MSRGPKPKYAQKQCIKTVGYLMQNLELVQPGARIGVAVSGGVDSFVLIQTLLIRKAILPFDIELMALHVNPGFVPDNHRPLLDWLTRNGVSAHLEVSDHGPRAHSTENRSNSACFYCSMLRRTRLFELCRDYRLTHLAFGHNNDDLAVTFFMNMFQGGRVDGMSAKESFFGGDLTVIRPLLFVDKKTIKAAARQWELPVYDNPCPSAGATRRSDVTAWLDERSATDKRLKKNVFAAVRRFQFERTKQSD